MLSRKGRQGYDAKDEQRRLVPRTQYDLSQIAAFHREQQSVAGDRWQR